MKVIGAGFGRTGTSSLKAALEILGFGPCYHMSEVMHHPEHVPLWVSAANGDDPDWNELFSGFQSTVDWPGALFWKQLATAFPEAKVLLNTRDPERWHESVLGTILHGHPDHPDFQRMSESVDEPGLFAVWEVWGAVTERQFGESAEADGSPGMDGFAGLQDKQRALEVFRRHYAEVQESIPADRLLVYEVKQGWEPLCGFLDVPVPDEPFPRLNERMQFQEVIDATSSNGHPQG